MMDRAGKKEQSRARILASAGRGFRTLGFGGLGIDGIARDAGVTSGAFYAHFPSKAVAFRETVAAGMADLREGVARFQREAGARWRAPFIDFYLGERRTCDLGESCALQALSGEVARADRATRCHYEAELGNIITLMGENKSASDRVEAIVLLALLAGGVSIARAVEDPNLSEEIANAVRSAAFKLTGSEPA